MTTTQKLRMTSNRILQADSYKLSHHNAYPEETIGMFASIEARKANKSGSRVIIPFGLQMYIMKELLTPLTREEVDEAESFANLHVGPGIFDRKPFDKVIDVYNGFYPIRIRAIPEGTVSRVGIPLVTIECTDPDLFWLVMYLETELQRAIWYPTTIASNDYVNYRIIKRYLSDTADTNDLLPFMLHDFAGRGVTCQEQAEIGGAAHMIYFMGSDTMSGIRAANWYYDCEMSGFSVRATEHSIQTAYGPLDQRRYLEKILSFGKPGGIIAIVLDGYDVYREAGILCGSLKDAVIACGAKIVFRPDSGDPFVVIERLLGMMQGSFGTTINSKGYKVLNHVGIIQGDGINTESMEAILKMVTDLGFAADNIVFGSGGGLLQKVNRDTFSFAQKANAHLVGKQWIEMYKDPITDPGKASKKGRITATRWKLTGELGYAQLTDKPLNDEFEDLMVPIYDTGKLLTKTTLAKIRELAKS